jgi:FlaA1/EpsC-like NDP-sugar epimerase
LEAFSLSKSKKKTKEAKPAILVTGGAGSIGAALTKYLANNLGKEYTIRVFDNNEYGIWHLRERLKNPNLRFLVGNVRDYPRLKEAMFGVKHIFHCAALKHVALCEYNPFDAVETNVIGTQNAIRAAFDNPTVEKFLYISTDKAVNPTSMMGASKLIGERLILAANYIKGNRAVKLSSARFPNVMETAGNVFEAWEFQYRSTGKLLVRDPEMTRYFIHIEKAVEFLMEAFDFMSGGEIFFPALTEGDKRRIIDVAREWLIQKQYDDAEIVYGIPEFGEKKEEELYTTPETPYVSEVSPTLSVIRPPTYDFSQWKVMDDSE